MHCALINVLVERLNQQHFEITHLLMLKIVFISFSNSKACLFQKNPLRLGGPCTYISFLAKECCSSLTLSGLPHREMESFSREVIFSSQETMGILNVEFSNLMKFCGITSQIHIKKHFRIILAEFFQEDTQKSQKCLWTILRAYR